MACKPGSVPIHLWRGMAIHLGRPLPGASSDQPGRSTRKPACRRSRRTRGAPPLFGLAPGGVCRAADVAAGAVRSYRTLSPLPASPSGSLAESLRGRGGRFAFCGTFPGVAPAGRYPAPCFRGARTFLPPDAPGSSHPAVWRHGRRMPGTRRRQARAAMSRRIPAVSPSMAPSTRRGRKWRWNAVTTSAVASSKVPSTGTP